MIIACPACQTRYVVPDSAIGVEGRTVRCAKCRHNWFQDGPEIELAERQEADAKPAPAPAPAPSQSPQAAPEQDQDLPPTADAAASDADGPSDSAESSVADEPADTAEEPPSREEALEGVDTGNDDPAPPPPEYDDPAPASAEPVDASFDYSDDYDETSQFDYEPPFRPRRNPLKIWTAAAVIFAFLAFGTIAAVSYWGMPEWLPINRPVFALQQADLELDFPAEQQDRRTLANGAEYFGASGTVTNTGRETREVPPILIVLRDQHERIVYSWEVTPPARTLAPGESARINEAVTDVPRSAAIAEIGWKPR